MLKAEFQEKRKKISKLETDLAAVKGEKEAEMTSMKSKIKVFEVPDKFFGSQSILFVWPVLYSKLFKDFFEGCISCTFFLFCFLLGGRSKSVSSK